MEYQEYINGKNLLMEAKHVSKEFLTGKGKKQTVFPVLNDINLKIYDNEFVVLFGPGECGKTTLINVLAGLDNPTAGEVVMGKETVTAPGIERGVVYQSISLFPWLTVMGNVSFGPKSRGVKKEEYTARSQQLIDLVGLSGFENSFPNSLSGGMAQRVGIARAYANEPKMLFMDEPFGALDAQTRYLMEKEILRIYQSEKCTVVFVTNNIEEAVYLADRVILMKNCPTSVKQEFIIDLPRPRSYTEPEFLRIRQEITDLMDKVY